MDIQSTSHSRHLLSLNPEKDVSKERIQSIECELESLGAVGGEGVSYAPKTERRTVAATDSPTKKLDTFLTHYKKQELLYGVHPILPSSAFKEEHLDEIRDTLKPLAQHIRYFRSFVEVKIAALKVQTVIIKMIRGEDSENEIQPHMISIRKFIISSFNLVAENTIPALDPHGLWPINREDLKKFNSLAIGQSEEKKYYDEFEAYLPPPPPQTEEERLFFKEKLDTILEKLLVFDKVSSHLNVKVMEKPYYLITSEKDIESIENKNPGICHKAKENNIFLVPHAVLQANDFEKKLLACYNLHIDLKNPKIQKTPKVKPLFFLDAYKELLRDDAKNKRLTAFQIQQIACTWVMTLSNNFTFYQTMLCLNAFYSKKKVSKNRRPKKDPVNTIGCERCLSLTKWAKDNGFLSIAAYVSIRKLSNSVLIESRKKEENLALKKLTCELQEYAIDAAIGDKKKQTSFAIYIGLCDEFGFKEQLYKAYDAASQYSLYPIIIKLWYDLGLCDIDQGSIILRPEYVVESLIKIGNQKKKLLSMEEDMYNAVKGGAIVQEDDPTISKASWQPAPIFYHYVVGKEEIGRKLLPYGRTHWHAFFVFLSLIAHEKFEKSVTFIEKFITNDGRILPLSVKEMRMKILPVLALVHKKIADTATCDTEKTKHLEQALSYLFTLAPTHKELYLSIAIIQEQLDCLKNAYDSYTIVEEHYKTFSKESSENCQLQFISQAKEKLNDRLLNSPDNTSPEKNYLQQPEQGGTLTKRKTKKEKENILTTTIAPQLTSDEKEVTLPLASLRMDKPSDTDLEIKEPAECIQNSTLESEECAQKDNDTNWTIVRKRTTPRLNVPYEITNEAFESAMSSTKHSRHFLSMKLLQSASIDYDDLFSEHDRLYDKTDNIILKQMVFQNKMWSIRHKTFNMLALDYESNRENIPVDNIKTALRARILESIYSNIESLIKRLTSQTLPEAWRNQPDIIFTLNDIAHFLDIKKLLRFRIQFGAQCSTMGHIMKDICRNQPNGATNIEYALSLFGRRNLDEFNDLATLFYEFRNKINPEHNY